MTTDPTWFQPTVRRVFWIEIFDPVDSWYRTELRFESLVEAAAYVEVGYRNGVSFRRRRIVEEWEDM